MKAAVLATGFMRKNAVAVTKKFVLDVNGLRSQRSVMVGCGIDSYTGQWASNQPSGHAYVYADCLSDYQLRLPRHEYDHKVPRQNAVIATMQTCLSLHIVSTP